MKYIVRFSSAGAPRNDNRLDSILLLVHFVKGNRYTDMIWPDLVDDLW